MQSSFISDKIKCFNMLISDIKDYKYNLKLKSLTNLGSD
jgi:hypothetical protein